MKYRACFTPLGGKKEVIKVCNSKNEAIDTCVDYRFDYYSCDVKDERRKGLEERGWAIIGYSGNEISIEEVPN